MTFWNLTNGREINYIKHPVTRDKRYSDEHYLVNQILAEWNPIGVPEGIADSEYTMYVQNMLRFRNDYDGLVIEMKRIVNDVIGLTFDNGDNTWKKEALSSVLEMFDWDKTKTLDKLIREISTHYKLKLADKK